MSKIAKFTFTGLPNPAAGLTLGEVLDSYQEYPASSTRAERVAIDEINKVADTPFRGKEVQLTWDLWSGDPDHSLESFDAIPINWLNQSVKNKWKTRVRRLGYLWASFPERQTENFWKNYKGPNPKSGFHASRKPTKDSFRPLKPTEKYYWVKWLQTPQSARLTQDLVAQAQKVPLKKEVVVFHKGGKIVSPPIKRISPIDGDQPGRRYGNNKPAVPYARVPKTAYDKKFLPKKHSVGGRADYNTIAEYQMAALLTVKERGLQPGVGDFFRPTDPKIPKSKNRYDHLAIPPKSILKASLFAGPKNLLGMRLLYDLLLQSNKPNANKLVKVYLRAFNKAVGLSPKLVQMGEDAIFLKKKQWWTKWQKDKVWRPWAKIAFFLFGQKGNFSSSERHNYLHQQFN